MLSMLPNVTFGETLYSATTTMVAYNTSLEGREYLQEGYIDQEQWQNKFNAKAAELESTHSELLELRDYLSEDNQAIVDNFNLDSFKYISELEETSGQFAAMRDEALAAKERQLERQRQQRAAQQQQQQAAQQQSYSGNSDSFKSQGVIYQMIFDILIIQATSYIIIARQNGLLAAMVFIEIVLVISLLLLATIPKAV